MKKFQLFNSFCKFQGLIQLLSSNSANLVDVRPMILLEFHQLAISHLLSFPNLLSILLMFETRKRILGAQNILRQGAIEDNWRYGDSKGCEKNA